LFEEHAIFGLHEQRRLELNKDIFAAGPLVWSRDPNRHFVAVLRRDVTLFALLLDRNGPGVDPAPLVKSGFASMLDVTAVRHCRQ
jgi:hypothetical protein